MPLVADQYSEDLTSTLEYPDWFKHWITTEYLKQPFNKLLDDKYDNDLILIQSPSQYIAFNKRDSMYGSFGPGMIRPTFKLDNEALTLNTLVKCYHGIVTELSSNIINTPTCLRYNVHYLKYADAEYNETTTCIDETTEDESSTTTTTTAEPTSTSTAEPPPPETDISPEPLRLRPQRYSSASTTKIPPTNAPTPKKFLSISYPNFFY